jgi:DNA replication protein DnaC
MYSEIQVLIIDDVSMRKLLAAAAEDLLEIVIRRNERAATIITKCLRRCKLSTARLG